VLLVTAFLAVMQLRTERSIRQILGVPSTRLEEFGYRLARVEAAQRDLQQEVETLRERVAAMRRLSAEGRAGTVALNAEVEQLSVLTGLTAVRGPGIVIEIGDSTRSLAAGEDPNDVLVHYTDLQAVVNDLWAAGAEAVAVNGERFTVRSSIQCIGTTVLLNGRRIAPPFRIQAIGDPGRLAAYVSRPQGTVVYLQAFGFPAIITRATRVLLPAYRGPLPLATGIAH
jgi:uncharacterized protein YlxW (UPF0749 family)